MTDMRLTAIAFLLSMSAAACTSSKGPNSEPVVPQNNNSSTDPNMDCRTERPIGSSIPRTNCESTQDRDMDRKGGQEFHTAAAQHGH